MEQFINDINKTGNILVSEIYNEVEVSRVKDKNMMIFLCDPDIYNEKTKEKKFLLNLKQKSIEDGIELIIIYTPELVNKYSIVINRLYHKLGVFDHKIYARNCEIKEVPSKECNNFLKLYHSQGPIASGIRCGLYYQNELVALMTFNKSRYNKNYDYEMGRYCIKTGYSIAGNASKILEYFRKNYNPKSLITYCDLRWSNCEVYEKIGFSVLHDTPSGFFWYKEGQMYNRRGWWKGKLSQKLEKFDPAISAHNNMRNNGFVKFFDIGQRVFQIKWE